jgi:alpha-ketoglutarate-dependent taurine dioxygenase
VTTPMNGPMDPLTRSGRDFWHGVLAAGGSTTVPRWTLDPAPGVADHETPISRRTVVAARRLAYDLGVPLRTVLLAVHARVLAALSGERDVVVGYVADPVARPLPCRLSTEPDSWRDMMQQTRRTESALRVYARFPVDDLRRELALPGPAFETVFDLAGAADVSGNAVLNVSFPERNGGRMLRLRYRTDVLDAACAARIAGYHLTALAQILADPDAEHRRQSLLSGDELRWQLDGLVRPARELPDRRAHELFEQRVAATTAPLNTRPEKETGMSASTIPDLDRRPGAPAILRTVADDPAAWAAEHRDALRAAVTEHGALLIRGLGLWDRAQVGAVFRELAEELMIEREAFAPRERHPEGTYSSTAWPAKQPMCMHHELSYTLNVPGLMLFVCVTAPAEGGATALADGQAVLEALPSGLVERFEREGWLLTRSYTGEIGASFADVFGTHDLAAVERYCRANMIETAWQADGGLRTRQRRPAVVRHPVTERRSWFNQIAFLSRWTLDPEVRDYLVEVYGEDGLPFDTRFGNGEPIGEDVVTLLNEVYDAHTVREPWQPGDLLLVDNIGTAHSREPYTGPRKVLVGMADPVSFAGLPGDGSSR